MKKYILLFIISFFSITAVWSQPPPEGACLCCEEDYTPSPDLDSDYQQCLAACGASADPFTYCDPVVPINSNILLLLALGISFGTYSIYQINKKRQFEN